MGAKRKTSPDAIAEKFFDSRALKVIGLAIILLVIFGILTVVVSWSGNMELANNMWAELKMWIQIVIVSMLTAIGIKLDDAIKHGGS